MKIRFMIVGDFSLIWIRLQIDTEPNLIFGAQNVHSEHLFFLPHEQIQEVILIILQYTINIQYTINLHYKVSNK